MAGMRIKLTIKAFIKITAIIFICCITASLRGNMLTERVMDRYINCAGAVLMLYLSLNALKCRQHHRFNIYAVAFSVAMDAAAVCIYLAACGYNIFYVSGIASLMHAIMISLGEKMSVTATHQWKGQTHYISCAIFFAMAVYKLMETVR